MPGSLSLIGGDPGIGKSTLLLQVSSQLANKGHDVLYMSGEESVKQTKLRAERLGVTSAELYVYSETEFKELHEAIEEYESNFCHYRLHSNGSSPGSNVCTRKCFTSSRMYSGINANCQNEKYCYFYCWTCNERRVKLQDHDMLEHMVDTVLYFEGERHHTYRILRAVEKPFWFYE